MKRGRLIILLVEDNEHDVFFVKRAIESSTGGHTVFPVQDGEEAIRYLRGEGHYANRQEFPVPNVILCDLKMPGMDGFEFLRWLRDHPEYQIIPLVVYSSSDLERDVREAYRLGANSYIVKPNELNDLVQTLRSAYEYWSRCACPPMRGVP